jgi:hypothetical protein
MTLLKGVACSRPEGNPQLAEETGSPRIDDLPVRPGFTGDPPGMRTVRRGPLIQVYQTDIRRGTRSDRPSELDRLMAMTLDLCDALLINQRTIPSVLFINTSGDADKCAFLHTISSVRISAKR